jgi:hypothetical protein
LQGLERQFQISGTTQEVRRAFLERFCLNWSKAMQTTEEMTGYDIGSAQQSSSELSPLFDRMKVSPEGIPWRDYHFVELLLSTLPGALVRVLFGIYKSTLTKEKSNLKTLPDNAIIFGFHQDILKTFSSPSLMSIRKSCNFLGYHGVLSYLVTIPFFNRTMQTFRFSRKLSKSPFHQIMAHLSLRPDKRLFMYTDAGGPYGHVRESLIDLCIQSQRPLVGIRHFCEREIRYGQHSIPLPGTRMITATTQVFTAQQLADFNHRKEAAKFLQASMDQLHLDFHSKRGSM